MADKEIKIKQIKGLVGTTKKQKQIIKALGLRKIGMEKSVKDSDTVRGALRLVEHLVKVVEEK